MQKVKEKNKRLQAERDLSFEQIIFAIENDQLLDILQHLQQDKYPGQLLLIVKIDNYAICVPVVEEENRFFLKTAYHSRPNTKKYLGGNNVLNNMN